MTQIGKECHNDCAIKKAVGKCVMPTEGIFAVVVKEGVVRPGDDRNSGGAEVKLIRTEEAVGHVLCHDMTQIIKDQYKDARFRKGHVVTEEDIPGAAEHGQGEPVCLGDDARDAPRKRCGGAAAGPVQ